MSKDFSTYYSDEAWYFRQTVVSRVQTNDLGLEPFDFSNYELTHEIDLIANGLGQGDFFDHVRPVSDLAVSLSKFAVVRNFTTTKELVTYSKLNTMQQTPSQNILSTSFRDDFVLKYHQNIFEHGLTSVSDNSGKIITKDSFDFIKSILSAVYHFDIYNKTPGIEGFVGNHTYFRMTHDIKEDLYYLNSVFSNNQEFINPILEKLVFLKKPPSVSWVTGISNDGDLNIDRIPLECPTLMDQTFYPWLGEGLSVEEYIDSYLEGNESILLLYGIPGSGKSNLLKYLLYRSGESALITYQDSIRDLDIMFSNFITGPNKFLIIEDADEFLVKRDQGNTSMKRLLNIADGLTSNKNKKIIFTTNLSSLSSIDEALLRDGRCFDAVQFDKLTKEQAHKVADYLQISKEDLNSSYYTLAQLFAIKNQKLKRRNVRERTKFGFGN